MRGDSVPARILVVDDDVLFREATVLTLSNAGHDVVSADRIEEAARLLREEAFGLLLADIRMPGNSQLEWLQQLGNEHPDLPVLVCTGYPQLDTAIEAVRLPVRAYLVKPVSEERLLDEVRQALVDPVGPGGRLQARLDEAQRRHRLTPRQLEVLGLLVEGNTNREIADRLGCALRTVELHVSDLLRGMGAASRTALVAKVWGGGDTGQAHDEASDG